VRAMRSGRVERSEELRPYLFTIAQNLVADHWRRRFRLVPGAGRAGRRGTASRAWPTRARESPEAAAGRRGIERRVRVALALLPERYQRAFRWRRRAAQLPRDRRADRLDARPGAHQRASCARRLIDELGSRARRGDPVMKSCETYEIELSSLLDGEAAPERGGGDRARPRPAPNVPPSSVPRGGSSRRADLAATSRLSDPRAETLWLAIRRLAAPGGTRRARGAATPWAARPARRGAGRARSRRRILAVDRRRHAGLERARRGRRPRGRVHAPRPRDGRAPFRRPRRRAAGAELRYQRAMLEVLKLVPALESEGSDTTTNPARSCGQ
jgi:hypothetical protein